MHVVLSKFVTCFMLAPAYLRFRRVFCELVWLVQAYFHGALWEWGVVDLTNALL